MTSPTTTRRTFAIISHPDAGKTTLTEKLLLFGGAIQLAGDVRARGEKRRARSDWMKIEQDRGISVTASAMCFEYGGHTFNLLDTPGHEDFSEDTYRTLTAVDSAVMVIDAAKGIEAQTRKLFEVCRLRDIPIMTFINKMDREAREPFEILDEVAEALALDVTPASWPIGQGKDFVGAYDLWKNQLLIMDRTGRHERQEGVSVKDLDDPLLKERLSSSHLEALQEQVEMARGLLPEFDKESYLAGHMTPVFFGSALWSFGIKELLDGLIAHAPSPRSQKTKSRLVAPDEKAVTGFVFKVQANMDSRHRDRVAFVRLMSGEFKRGMKLKHVRTQKQLTISSPVLFMAQSRETADEAFAGDILGIPNHGTLRIGDTLTEGEDLQVVGIPVFAPEFLSTVRADDPMKSKHLKDALDQFAEEGSARVFRTVIGGTHVVGVVGQLQFEVLKERIQTEYGIPTRFETASYMAARWVQSSDKVLLDKFLQSMKGNMAEDHNGHPVYLARSNWDLNKVERDWEGVNLLKSIDAVS